MNAWRWATNVLAAIGAVLIILGAGVWFLGQAVFGGTDMPAVEEALLSPSGVFEAVRIVNSGGGAAGWCRVFVVVRSSGPIQTVPTYSHTNNELVFSARCNSRFTMRWATPNELVVHYKLTPAELVDFELRPTDKTGKVLVRFESEV